MRPLCVFYILFRFQKELEPISKQMTSTHSKNTSERQDGVRAI